MRCCLRLDYSRDKRQCLTTFECNTRIAITLYWSQSYLALISRSQTSNTAKTIAFFDRYCNTLNAIRIVFIEPVLKKSRLASIVSSLRSTESLIQTMENTDRKPETSNAMSGPLEVRYVTIGGKQVEVKYELCATKVDIFGLHKDKRNGSDRRSAKNPNVRRATAYQRNEAKRYPLWDGPNHLADNGSNNSVGSRDSYSDSLNSVTKANKVPKNVESEEERFHKKSDSIDKVTNKLKKDKEPIKVENKFDKLLSTMSAEDFDANTEANSSSKKNKKKRNKSNRPLSPTEDFSDTYSEKSESKNAIAVQNQSNQSSTVVDSQLNNSYLFNNNCDDKLNTIDKDRHKLWETQPNLKVFKNSFGGSDDNKNLINDFNGDNTRIDGLKTRDNKKMTTNVMNGTPHMTETNVSKSGSPKRSDKQSNGGLKVKEKPKNKKFLNHKSEELQTLIEEPNGQSSTLSMWFFISGVTVASLVLYAIVILRLFCDCKY